MPRLAKAFQKAPLSLPTSLPGNRPTLPEGADVARTETGKLITFANGATVETIRTVDDITGALTVDIVRTAADGSVTTGSIAFPRDDDGLFEPTFTRPDGTIRSVVVDREAGTRSVTVTQPDGDVIVVTQSLDRAAQTKSSQVVITEADGDTGTLTVLTSRGEAGGRTVEIAGTLPDGRSIDSTLVFDRTAGTVTVTDAEGDSASFSLADFGAEVRELGLIGVIADIAPIA